ncbi:MAG: DUF1653 domain-containing protein [Clostridiales bacterium]|nr:DUF1653 domain-containing protein [Clostridiales bacterium]
MVKINGVYKHFKGNLYKVLCVAKNSETLQEEVVYKALYGDGGVWVRPLTMFEESVTFNGKTVLRFELIDKD